MFKNVKSHIKTMKLGFPPAEKSVLGRLRSQDERSCGHDLRVTKTT